MAEIFKHLNLDIILLKYLTEVEVPTYFLTFLMQYVKITTKSKLSEYLHKIVDDHILLHYIRSNDIDL